MKESIFNKMIKNAPSGSTHYRRKVNCVVFYRNVDISFGSYDSVVWFSDEDCINSEWYTKRSYLNMEGVKEL